LGPSKITYRAIGSPDGKITTVVEDGMPVLYVNKGACKVLAEIFAKLALGSHSKGFHIHLHDNFDDKKKEILRIGIGFD
jgi:hypothetical protein